MNNIIYLILLNVVIILILVIRVLSLVERNEKRKQEVNKEMDAETLKKQKELDTAMKLLAENVQEFTNRWRIL